MVWLCLLQCMWNLYSIILANIFLESEVAFSYYTYIPDFAEGVSCGLSVNKVPSC